MVETQNISKIFRDPKRGVINAVNQVNFRAIPGQIHGLLGVNGAGKTTLLRLLSTVIYPSEGTANIAGFDLHTQAAKIRANIGFLSSSTALYGRLTGREMLEYFAGLYGFEKNEISNRVSAALETTQSHEFASQLCDKMSTGQKQRISIARAILHDPPVLFFDEPTNGLDILTSQTIMSFVELCREQCKTIIYSTHIMSEVERLCDHVTIIHQGQIQGSGTVEELKLQASTSSLEKTFLHYISQNSKEEAC